MKLNRIHGLLLLLSLALLPLAAANAQTFNFTQGNFYGTQGNTIVSYDSAGAQLGSLQISGVSGLRGLAFGPDGLLYVVNANGGGLEVHAVNSTGQVQMTYSYDGWIGGNISWGKIAFDKQGAFFYVGTLPGVVRFTVGTPLSGTIVPGTDGPFGIYDLTVLPSGNLLAADSYNIFEITADGAQVRHSRAVRPCSSLSSHPHLSVQPPPTSIETARRTFSGRTTLPAKRSAGT